MTDMGGIFGILGVACGVYILYALFKLKKTGEITGSILLPKDVDPKKCKDKEAYIKAVTPKMAALGIVTLIYGLADLCNTYVRPIGNFFWAVLIAVFAVLIWFATSVSKLNKTYF